MAREFTLEERIELRHKRGRKASDLVADLPRPQGRDVMWKAIRRLKTFTLAQLESDTFIPQDTLRSYLRGLELAGFLTKTPSTQAKNDRGVPTFTAGSYTLVRDVGVQAPRVTRKGALVTQGGINDAMWLAMRALRAFSHVELVATANAGDVEVQQQTAQTYIKFLTRAGYLRQISKGGPGVHARYQLIPAMNTGPKAPQIQSVKQVFDLNRNQVMPFLAPKVAA